MLPSPKTLQSWGFQWRKGEPDRTSLEERQMTARRHNLIWEACEFEGELWLYFTSLVFIPLLLHTPHRLCEAVRRKEIWHRRGRGHALGTPGLVEPLWDMLQDLGGFWWASMGHGEGHSDATCTLVKDGLLSPWMLWKWHRNCCARFSGLCYAQNQTRCSLTVFKFSYNKILSCFPFSLNVRNISFQSPATFFFQFKRASFFYRANSEVVYFLWDLLLLVTHSLNHEKRQWLS